MRIGKGPLERMQLQGSVLSVSTNAITPDAIAARHEKASVWSRPLGRVSDALLAIWPASLKGTTDLVQDTPPLNYYTGSDLFQFTINIHPHPVSRLNLVYRPP
jgi:hypothetical protein